MNAESEIAAAVAALRGPGRPKSIGMASRNASGRHRTPAPNQAGGTKRFAPPSGGRGAIPDPWPRRPRFAGTARRAVEGASAVAARPAVVGVAALVFAAGLLRVAAELGRQSGPYIFHLVWPV